MSVHSPTLRSPVRSPPRLHHTSTSRSPPPRSSAALMQHLSSAGLPPPSSSLSSAPSPLFSAPHTNNSTLASALDLGTAAADGDVSRVQLLLRVLELEKRLSRSEDRLARQDEATRARMSEMAASHALSADRATSFLQRLNEVELSSREAEIGVSALEQRLGAESDSLSALRQHVQSVREESKRELREELSKNISLRAATHQSELVSLMDRQQEQHAKLLRAHELTSQGFHTKLQAVEAKWSARQESLEQRVAAMAMELQGARERHSHLESRVRDMGVEHEQALSQQSTQLQNHMMSSLEQVMTPLSQQVALQGQLSEQQLTAHATQLATHYSQLQTHSAQIGTVHAQLEYGHGQLSDKCVAMEQALNGLKSAQLNLQQSVLQLSDQLTNSLQSVRDALPAAKADLERASEALHQRVDALSQQLSSECGEQRTQLSTLTTRMDQMKSQQKRNQQLTQLMEEQLATIQARVLVAGENAAQAAPFQALMASSAAAAAAAAASRNGLPTSPLTSPQRFRSSPPVSASAPVISSPLSHPYQSPFTAAALNLHLSDAAGLKGSPGARSFSPMPPVAVRNGINISTAEDDFVACLLGQK